MCRNRHAENSGASFAIHSHGTCRGSKLEFHARTDDLRLTVSRIVGRQVNKIVHVQKTLRVSPNHRRVTFAIYRRVFERGLREPQRNGAIGNFSRHFVTVSWNRRATSSSATVTRAQSRSSTLYVQDNGLDNVTNFLVLREKPIIDDRYPTEIPRKFRDYKR